MRNEIFHAHILSRVAACYTVAVPQRRPATKVFLVTNSSAEPTTLSTGRAVGLVACMWFAYFLNYCDRQVVAAIYPALKADLGFRDDQLGLTVAVFMWIYGIGCPIAGQLGDRFSKRRLVVLSLVIWSLVTAATGLATGVTSMLWLRAAMGVSEALFMPAAVALVGNAFPPHLRSRVIAILSTAQIVGIIAGSRFGGVMADHGLWRGAFFALGAVGVAYAVPYFWFLRRVDETPADARPNVRTETAQPQLGSRPLFHVPTFVLLCVTFPTFLFGLWLIYGWLPNFLGEKFSLNMGDAALNATIYLQGATLVGVLGGGYLADALQRRTTASRFWLLTASLLLSAPSLYALGRCDTLELTRVAAVAFGLFSGLFMGNIFPAAYDVVAADRRASAVGVLNLFGALMGGSAAYFGGRWKSTIGIDGLFAGTSAAYLVAGAALIAGIVWLFPRDYAWAHDDPRPPV